MAYLHWDEKTITDFSDEAVAGMYARGYVFTRIGKGVMQQTRSVRVDLSKFQLSSENRRILKKAGDLTIGFIHLPMAEYDVKLGKLAKDFYEEKFGPGVMSAQKIKEMLTDSSKSNFTTLLAFSKDSKPLGYTICYATRDIIHYSYPFYDLNESPKDMGLGMMTKIIAHVKEAGTKYIYLGSLQRPTDMYKLQFEGIEWFDGKEWQRDIEKVKEVLNP